ncbi:MAG TPA: hypothetical protein P5328_00435 [Candidatus Paceibacterota bacterium]|nr:hypothetical protein [Candidatus Paceibacterota bacterium]HRZ34207.1 hypothetical protein [Candidatus Paceibacterota bacterium]
MGLFWNSSKPNVSKTEFRERVLSHLSARNWSSADRDKVKMAFAGHLDESNSESGIDKKEIKQGIEILRKTSNISDDRLKDLEDHMNSLAK